jgi:WD40 repeat protein
VGGHRNLQILAVPSGKVLHSVKIAGDQPPETAVENSTVQDVAFSPDGKLLAIAVQRTKQDIRPHHSGEVEVFDGATLRRLRVLRGHKRSVRAVVFMPDNKTLISGSLDSTIRLWPLELIEN